LKQPGWLRGAVVEEDEEDGRLVTALRSASSLVWPPVRPGRVVPSAKKMIQYSSLCNTHKHTSFCVYGSLGIIFLYIIFLIRILPIEVIFSSAVACFF
jgi:hypothetical protein